MTALADHLRGAARPRLLPRTWRRGPGPVAVPGPAVPADRSGTVRDQARTVRSWPLLVLAAFPPPPRCGPAGSASRRRPASARVSLLPGIWSSLHLDTTITLPVGVECYAAYALRAWLAGEPAISDRTRRFARWSAICSFALGMAGQVAYPPDGPGRVSPGALGHHHPRVLPPGPGPGHGDRAGPPAARGRLGPGQLGQPVRGTIEQAVPGLVRRGPARSAAGPEPRDQDHGPDQFPSEDQRACAPRFGSTTQHRRAVGPRSSAPSGRAGAPHRPRASRGE